MTIGQDGISCRWISILMGQRRRYQRRRVRQAINAWLGCIKNQLAPCLIDKQ